MILMALFLPDGRICRAGGHDYYAGTPDPVGDAFGVSPQHDVIQLDLFLDTDSLYIVGTFNAAIYPPGSGSNQLLGYIDLDIDHNPATGSPSYVSSYGGYPQCGNSGLGIEYYVEWYEG
jgi:hypothetical protein